MKDARLFDINFREIVDYGGQPRVENDYWTPLDWVTLGRLIDICFEYSVSYNTDRFGHSFMLVLDRLVGFPVKG